jgi:hypothetical protein
MLYLVFFLFGVVFGAVVIPFFYGVYRKYKLRQTIWFKDGEE